MGSALHLPEWHLGNKGSRLGPLETRERGLGEGEVPQALEEQRVFGLGMAALP